MNQVALVTGAYRGLGLETVRQLAKLGYHTILTGRRSPQGMRVVSELESEGHQALYVDLDVTDSKSIAQARLKVELEYGKLDVLVNNAGIHYDMGNSSLDPSWIIVDEALSTNFLGPWKVTVGFLPLLQKSDGARIVNVSSGAGSLIDVTPGTPAYSTSKAALNMLTIQLASELKEQGIKVNAVCPGWVRTEMGGQQAPRSVEEGAAGIVWAATLDDQGPTGGFFRDGKPINW